jgi:hypothetical protein
LYIFHTYKQCVMRRNNLLLLELHRYNLVAIFTQPIVIFYKTAYIIATGLVILVVRFVLIKDKTDNLDYEFIKLILILELR